jgi:beta-lactamase class A
MGLAVRDFTTGETLFAKAYRHFVAGSLYKLGVAAEAYARISQGTLQEKSCVVVDGKRSRRGIWRLTL